MGDARFDRRAVKISSAESLRARRSYAIVEMEISTCCRATPSTSW